MTDIQKDYVTKLKEIEGYVDSGKTVPFGTLVNTKTMNQHLAELKEIVQAQIQEAERIIQMENEIIADAKTEAQTIIENTKQEVMNQDIAQQAEDYARNLVFKAQEEAKEKIKDATELRQKMLISMSRYFENLYDEIDNQFTEKQNILAEDREELRNSLQKKIEMMDKLAK